MTDSNGMGQHAGKHQSHNAVSIFLMRLLGDRRDP
jgi:hypothetical protein